MSAFHFGIVKEALGPREVSRRESIAKRHGATFVWVGLNGVPGSDLRGWFSAPNQGEPFDRALAKVVLDEVGIRGGAHV